MKYVWKYMDRLNRPADTKYRLSLLFCSLLFALVGLCVWGIVQMWALKTIDWMIVFVGYPFFISWVLVFLYSGRHDFHDGVFRE